MELFAEKIYTLPTIVELNTNEQYFRQLLVIFKFDLIFFILAYDERQKIYYGKLI